MSVQAINANQAYATLNQPLKEEAVAHPLGEMAANFSALFEKADTNIADYAAGTIDGQSVVEAISQAEMALQTAVTVRDRVVGAYQELLRMPL
ncbi:MAG: flagellar hook-basal body complex protein FliE [Pseudomonadota bacterium]